MAKKEMAGVRKEVGCEDAPNLKNISRFYDSQLFQEIHEKLQHLGKPQL